MEYIPSKDQWNKWTLPSKASYIGGAITVFSVIITLIYSNLIKTDYDKEVYEIIKKIEKEINNKPQNIKNTEKQAFEINSKESELLLLFPLNNMNDSITQKAIHYYARGAELRGVNKNEAIKMYTKALEIKPDFSAAYYSRANLYSLIDKFDLAIKDYTTVIKHNDKISNAYYYRGNSLMHSNKYESAIKDYSIAILLNPKFAKAYLYRGNTKTFLKDDKGALNDLKKSIELAPNNDVTYYNLGLIFFRSKNYDKALFNYTKAIELNSSDYKYYEKRAYTYLFKREFNKSCADIKRASSLGLNITKNGSNLICDIN